MLYISHHLSRSFEDSAMLSSKNDLHSPSYMLGLYHIFVLTTRKKKKKNQNTLSTYSMFLCSRLEYFTEIKFTVVLQSLPILPGQIIFLQSFISSILSQKLDKSNTEIVQNRLLHGILDACTDGNQE